MRLHFTFWFCFLKGRVFALVFHFDRFKFCSNKLQPWQTRSSAAMTGTAAASRRTPPLPLGIFSLYQHFFFFVSFFHHSPLAINHNSTAGFRSNVSYTLLFYFYFFFSFFLLIPSVLQPAHTRLCTWQKKKENINKYWFFFGGEGGGGVMGAERVWDGFIKLRVVGLLLAALDTKLYT